MDQVNDRVDAECQQVFERLIGPTPIPNTARRVDFVPGNSIARCSNAETGHQTEVRMPALRPAYGTSATLLSRNYTSLFFGGYRHGLHWPGFGRDFVSKWHRPR